MAALTARCVFLARQTSARDFSNFASINVERRRASKHLTRSGRVAVTGGRRHRPSSATNPSLSVHWSRGWLESAEVEQASQQWHDARRVRVWVGRGWDALHEVTGRENEQEMLKCVVWDQWVSIGSMNVLSKTYINSTGEPLYSGQHWDPAGCPV